MLKTSIQIASKDFKIIFSQGTSIVQALLLGLLLIFVFSLSSNPGEYISPQTAATIFWLASAFCQVLTFNMLYEIETITSSLTGLLLMPKPLQSIWLGKAFVGLVIIFITQCFFLPATLILLTQTIGPLWNQSLLIIFIVDIGLAILGSLMGGLSQGEATRESILSIILFPLIVPLLFSGIRTFSTGLQNEPSTENILWINLAIAFDAIFFSVGFVLFPFLLKGDK